MIKIIQADARHIPLADKSCQTCITSPPYWGQRLYESGAAEIGQEPLHDCLGWARGEDCGACFVCTLRGVFREVYRVLRDDGTAFLNLGDSYANDEKWGGRTGGKHAQALHGESIGRAKRKTGLAGKNLTGIPWRCALALQADGWILRSDMIWHKPNAMPSSVTDRPNCDHEYIFLLAKKPRYYYDHVAVQVAASYDGRKSTRMKGSTKYLASVMPGQAAHTMAAQGHERWQINGAGERVRNFRTVMSVPTSPYAGSHFAVYPKALIRPFILAGTSPQACPHCAAPFERVVETVVSTSKSCPKTTAAHIARGGTGNPVGTLGKSGGGRIDGYTSTLGWQPTCQCPDNDGSGRCIVLDPFSGTSTTGEVCGELDRDYIGLELNPDYIKLAQKRTKVSQRGLFTAF